MTYNYFHIRYLESGNGKNDKAYSAYHCTTSPSTIDSLHHFLRTKILKNPNALVTIFSLQPLERDMYLSRGGIVPVD